MVFENNQLVSKIIPMLLLALLAGLSLSAQKLSYALDNSSAITIEGTSTLHEWTATVGEYTGTLSLAKAFDTTKDQEMSVDQVKLSFKVESIDGGRGPVMNKKIKRALKSTEHPTIDFSIDQSQVLALNDKSMQVSGTLKMAGVSKEVTLSVTPSTNPETPLAFVAKYPLKMSTFGIEPPSAMFGQIVTSDDVTIVFDLKFSAANN